MRRSVDRQVRRQTWLMVVGMALFATGLVIGAQDHSSGGFIAVAGGVIAVAAFIARG